MLNHGEGDVASWLGSLLSPIYHLLFLSLFLPEDCFLARRGLLAFQITCPSSTILCSSGPAQSSSLNHPPAYLSIDFQPQPTTDKPQFYPFFSLSVLYHILKWTYTTTLVFPLTQDNLFCCQEKKKKKNTLLLP